MLYIWIVLGEKMNREYFSPSDCIFCLEMVRNQIVILVYARCRDKENETVGKCPFMRAKLQEVDTSAVTSLPSSLCRILFSLNPVVKACNAYTR